MEAKQKLTIQFELLFWLFTLILIAAFSYPIYKTGASFPFYAMLALFIAAFITLTRYIFLMKFTFLAYNMWVNNQLNTFQTFIDEEGLDQYFRFMPLVERIDLQKYIRAVMIFFGTGSIIAAIVFPFRLMISIWRNFNRESV